MNRRDLIAFLGSTAARGRWECVRSSALIPYS